MQPLIIITIAYFLLIFTNAKAVESELSLKIDCHEVFREAVQKLEANYLVYKKMELKNELDTYNGLKKQFSYLLKNLKTEQCTEIISKFTDYFEDGHLSVIELPEYDPLILEKHSKEIKKKLLNPGLLI